MRINRRRGQAENAQVQSPARLASATTHEISPRRLRWFGHAAGPLREALRIRSGLASRDRLVRAWIREDPLLGYLVWAGPLSTGQRGLLTTHLDEQALGDCEVHLDALDELRLRPPGLDRSDIISRLILVLGHLAAPSPSTGTGSPRQAGGPIPLWWAQCDCSNRS